MKRAVLAVLLLTVLLMDILACSAFALFSWETGKMPYKPSMTGEVCWTTMREYKEDLRKEGIFHSMDLSTGKISTRPLDDWYLIQTDLSQNGTLIARHSDGILQIAQYSGKGKWSPFLEYSYDNTYTYYDAAINMNYSRSVIAYIDGWLYYMMSDGEKEWVRRDDMCGNVHDYSTGHRTSRISPNGNLDGVDTDGNNVIETADGSVYIIGRNDEENRRCSPIVWLDDDRMLLWIRKYVYEYSYSDDKFTPVCNDKNEHIYNVQGNYSYTASYNPSTKEVVQLIFWADDFFCVPVVLNLSTGLPVFIAETEHTASYDEYCTTSDRVVWLTTG